MQYINFFKDIKCIKFIFCKMNHFISCRTLYLIHPKIMVTILSEHTMDNSMDMVMVINMHIHTMNTCMEVSIFKCAFLASIYRKVKYSTGVLSAI